MKVLVSAHVACTLKADLSPQQRLSLTKGRPQMPASERHGLMSSGDLGKRYRASQRYMLCEFLLRQVLYHLRAPVAWHKLKPKRKTGACSCCHPKLCLRCPLPEVGFHIAGPGLHGLQCNSHVKNANEHHRYMLLQQSELQDVQPTWSA